MAYLSALPLLLTALFVYAACAHGVVRVAVPWAPTLGIDLSFSLDGLGSLMAVLICGVGFFVFLYAAGYLKHHPLAGRFFLFLTVFMISMLGLVTTDNVIVLFVFWELTGLSSYFLIGFHHGEEGARNSALQALLVTGAGGLCLLAGSLLLGNIAGTYEISGILRSENLRGHPWTGPAMALMLVAAFTKSAQFPFHFWLPNAMAAPTPVSAYLHSSTMVKAGIYLLARFSPLFGDLAAWKFALVGAGTLTVFAGVRMSLREDDMKRQLAYMTVAALGLITLMLGLGTPLAVHAAVAFLAAHAFYKGALFMVVGAIDHETHCRDAARLGGLAGKMPVTAVSAILAGLAMAGAPPFFSFVAKEALFEAALGHPWFPVCGIALSLAGTAFVLYALVICGRPFFGPLVPEARKAAEPPPSMWMGPACLGAGGLVLGLFPFLAEPWVNAAAAAITDDAKPYKMALWHGMNPAFVWSAAVFLAGIGVFRVLGALRSRAAGADRLLRIGPGEIYGRLVGGLTIVALTITRRVQNGSLRRYLKVTFLAAAALGAFRLVPRAPEEAGPFGFVEVSFCALIIAAAVAAARTPGRLTAVAYLSAVGLGVTLIFLFFGAPDLAMTQFTVDVLTVILLALVLYRMPPSRERMTRRKALVDAGIACTVGALMFLLVLSAIPAGRPLPAISAFYAENSLAAAHGRNIVNVILVDFRAIDTLGEITVLILAGLGAYSLLTFSEEKRKDAP